MASSRTLCAIRPFLNELHMKIIKTKVLTGPNLWSARRFPLIEMLVDLGDLENRPTNMIPGFYNRLLATLPTMYAHRCSEGREGGFFHRVKEGTWMGHVMEHVALELQTLADMDTGFGRTRSAHAKGLYNVVFSCVDAEAGRYAGEAAAEICIALASGANIDLNPVLQRLKDLWTENRFGPSTQSIVDEARRRDIPVMRLNSDSFVQLGYGAAQKRIEATIASTTGSMAVELAGDKDATKQILGEAAIPVPRGLCVSDASELPAAIEKIGFPLVIKPLDGNHGRGITTNICTLAAAKAAFDKAQQISNTVICEKHIVGHDFRVLVVNFKVVAAARRTPASVVGDGIHTITELVNIVNQDPRRGQHHENVLTCISLDECAHKLIEQAGWSPNDILPNGRQLILKSTANLSTGGTAEDVTDEIHPSNIALFERAARTIGLNICGIDVIATDLATPLKAGGGAIVEVNAAPGLRMHLKPSKGLARDIAGPIVDMLFPHRAPSRIPIIAVTGTNGKTTTTRLTAHIMQHSGLTVGYTTTDGIYIGDELVNTGDCSGPSSAQLVLKDSSVECAVLECARGGILRSGLGFDRCNVGILTNIAEDHLGLQGVDTLEALARVKSVVLDAVHETGTAILNADDDIVYELHKNLSCKVALFSTIADNPRVLAHCERGGTAAVFKRHSLYLMRGTEEVRVENVSNVPCTFDGAAEFNVANALAALLACAAQQVPLHVIRYGLRTFRMSAEQTPGRLNLFEIGQSKVLLDYAHNPHGLRAIGKFVSSINVSKRIGVIAGVGDRRDEDIMAMGEVSATIFDEIIVRQDGDTRGRRSDEIDSLITSGINRIDPAKRVTHFDSEPEAIRFALDNLEPDTLLVLCVDDIAESIRMVKEKQREKITHFGPIPVAV